MPVWPADCRPSVLPLHGRSPGACGPDPHPSDGMNPRPPVAVAAAPVPTGEVEVVPLTGMRKAIARRMTEAWAAPVFQITMTAEMTAAIRLREGLVARMAEGDAKPTYSDILTKVCAVALRRHPAVNALFAGDEIHLIPTSSNIDQLRRVAEVVQDFA